MSQGEIAIQRPKPCLYHGEDCLQNALTNDGKVVPEPPKMSPKMIKNGSWEGPGAYPGTPWAPKGAPRRHRQKKGQFVGETPPSLGKPFWHNFWQQWANVLKKGGPGAAPSEVSNNNEPQSARLIPFSSEITVFRGLWIHSWTPFWKLSGSMFDTLGTKQALGSQF